MQFSLSIVFSNRSFVSHKSRSSNGNAGEATLTVVFHAVISDKFKMDEQTKIVIRGEEPIFHGWSNDSVVVRREG